MNRIMLVVMVITALCLHCSFCQWDLCEHEPLAAGAHANRVLYYRYDRSWNSDFYLLSRGTASRDDAMLYGVGVPLLVCGAAVVVLRHESGSAGS